MGRYRTIAAGLLLVAGLCLAGSGLWLPAKARLAQHLLERAWQRSLVTGEIVRPWPWADTWPVGRLRQLRLGIDLIVLEGESGEVLAFGPGHLSMSGPPGGNDHCMLAGHRDTSFAFLEQLRPGDLLTVEGRAGKNFFLVRASGVVRAENLYLDPGRPGMLTLITCYPFRAVDPGTPWRYMVTATSR